MNENLIKIIHLYQILFSPDSGGLGYLAMGGCRFYPSCSRFAIGVLTKHTTMHAFGRIALRILSCHPWSRRPYIDIP